MFVHKGFTFSYLFLGWFLYMEVGHLSRCAVCLGDHLSRIFAACAQKNTKVLFPGRSSSFSLHLFYSYFLFYFFLQSMIPQAEAFLALVLN